MDPAMDQTTPRDARPRTVLIVPAQLASLVTSTLGATARA
jgi:hypothetical protein